VIDVIEELRTYGVRVWVHDPVVDAEEARKAYGIDVLPWGELPVADAIILAVAHDSFLKRPIRDFAGKVAAKGSVIDVKSKLDAKALRDSGLNVWRL
jgi:UDP-N-acetyl-D-galactosamine dehydrogenase